MNHDGTQDYRVQRTGKGVVETSYDCVAEIHHGIRALVNIKVCKNDGVNSAVAAIRQLYADYVTTDPATPKCFLVVKVYYDFCKSIRNGTRGERAISIKGVRAFFLDEVDLSKEHKQDHRSWYGKGKDANSGRLQVSDNFLQTHRVEAEAISYSHTVAMLEAICARNRA